MCQQELWLGNSTQQEHRIQVCPFENHTDVWFCYRPFVFQGPRRVSLTARTDRKKVLRVNPNDTDEPFAEHRRQNETKNRITRASTRKTVDGSDLRGIRLHTGFSTGVDNPTTNRI